MNGSIQEKNYIPILPHSREGIHINYCCVRVRYRIFYWGGGGGGGTYHQLHTLRLMEDFFFVGGEEAKHIDCIIAYDVCE